MTKRLHMLGPFYCWCCEQQLEGADEAMVLHEEGEWRLICDPCRHCEPGNCNEE